MSNKMLYKYVEEKFVDGAVWVSLILILYMDAVWDNMRLFVHS